MRVTPFSSADYITLVSRDLPGEQASDARVAGVILKCMKCIEMYRLPPPNPSLDPFIPLFILRLNFIWNAPSWPGLFCYRSFSSQLRTN